MCSHKCRCTDDFAGFKLAHFIMPCCSKCELCGWPIKKDLMDTHLNVCHTDILSMPSQLRRNFNRQYQPAA